MNITSMIAGIFCALVGLLLFVSWVRDRSILMIGWATGLLTVAGGLFAGEIAVEILGVVIMVASYMLDEAATARMYQKHHMNLQEDALREIGPLSSDGEQNAVPHEIILNSPGEYLDEVVRVIRSIYVIDQIHAEYMVIGCPRPVKQFISKTEADYVKSKLEEVGAEVEVRPM